jgi:hypothetical protein
MWDQKKKEDGGKIKSRKQRKELENHKGKGDEKKDEKYGDNKMSYELPEEKRWHAKACKYKDGDCRGR